MAEIIDAYDTLMDDDLNSRVGDSRVALACEMYSIDELRKDGNYDVYDLRVLFDGAGTAAVDKYSVSGNTKDRNLDEFVIQDMMPKVEVIYETNPHPDDSVWDLKCHVQDKYKADWGLEGRRKSRDGALGGWELVSPDGSVMSYHLFLHTYEIKTFDVIHAVVGRYFG